MGYILEFKVDGGCRGNGQPGAIGAAAAVLLGKNGKHLGTWTSKLAECTRPTNQRAEITAIIVALENALKRYHELNQQPSLKVIIMSDSKYAIGCRNGWVYKWSTNGWTNAAGLEVANRDLITEASTLDDQVKKLGKVVYRFIPRSENKLADDACNKIMNQMENESRWA
jgi:ribonuclease HI